MLRSVHLISGIYGRWNGTAQTSDIRPFETIRVPSTKSNRRITVNAYRTKGAMAPDVGPVAVHLTWHGTFFPTTESLSHSPSSGSGFVFYSYGESVPFVAHLLSHPLLESYPLVILDCDYAKSPEYPSPAATDDVRDVLEYAFARPEEFDLDRVTVGGFSAGATMSLGVCAAIGKEVRAGKPLGKQTLTSEHPVKAIIAFYPSVEWGSRPEVQVPAGVPGLAVPQSLIDTFAAAYFYPPGPLSEEEDMQRKDRQLHDPLLTPRWADPHNFPKSITLVTCEYDPLTAEAEDLRGEVMKPEYGKQVTGWMVKNVAHAWDVLVLPGQTGYEERLKAYDLAAKVIAKAGGLVE